MAIRIATVSTRPHVDVKSLRSWNALAVVKLTRRSRFVNVPWQRRASAISSAGRSTSFVAHSAGLMAAIVAVPDSDVQYLRQANPRTVAESSANRWPRGTHGLGSRDATVCMRDDSADSSCQRYVPNCMAGAVFFSPPAAGFPPTFGRASGTRHSSRRGSERSPDCWRATPDGQMPPVVWLSSLKSSPRRADGSVRRTNC